MSREAMSAEFPEIDLRMLGPVRVWRDDTELTLGSARRTAVLCVLALHAGRSVSRAELVAAVWGEDPPPSATGNIYTYVSTLRQVLEPARSRWAAGRLLSSGGGTYQLHLPPDCVDVVRFERLRETARQQRAAGDTRAELATVQDALLLWHGAALAGVPGPFAQAQRLRLAALRLATAERHAALLAETGRHEESARVLRGLMAANPLREDLRARLTDAPHEAGRDADPVPATTDGTVATGSRPESPPTPGTATDVRPDHRELLVGRDPVLHRLRRAAAGVALGRGGSLLIRGPAGIGKSTLLEAALRRVTTPQRSRIGWAVGDSGSRRTPLGTLLECLDSAQVADPIRHELDTLATVAEPRDPAEPRDRAEPGDPAGVDLADRAVRLICRAAADTPLVLVVDDLQWADPTTQRAWATLTRHTAGLPLLLVAVVRSGEPLATRQSLGELIELPPLDSDAASALVRAVAPEPPEPEELARILDDAGGHPQYLRQLAGGEAGAPPTADLAATVGAHLAPFTEDTRQVLRAVAFLSAYELRAPGTQPPGCRITELAAVTDRGAEELTRALAPARAHGILAPSDRLRLRHRIVARTLYESTPAALRVAVCRLYGRRLAAAGAAPDRVVAQLLAAGVPVDDWLGGWLAEHVAQIAGTAPQIAIAVLQQVHAQQALDLDQQLLFTAWLARLLLRQERHAAAEAGWVAARTTEPELRGEMRWTAAHSHERRGEFEAAAEIAHVALRERRISPPWLEELRTLLARVRPHLPGNPTQPHLSRSAIIEGEHPVAR
ncbi:AAA family ATPase [Micromonospora matsumotoense]|nr:AAA family ATPase [Micromonospora matsumotoense]